jgi:hypothetical protein
MGPSCESFSHSDVILEGSTCIPTTDRAVELADKEKSSLHVINAKPEVPTVCTDGCSEELPHVTKSKSTPLSPTHILLPIPLA